MTTGSIGPGTVLAGRYRLEDLLTESEGARFWRATDTVLVRSVAIHAVASDDPRAPGLMEAARISATVTDPHLLRVLDCDDSEGITWVVNEWGDGISLDLMLQQGTLPASRAAWLAREVADAIAAGHARGVAHGRLNPEAVLVTHAGAVKLIGYVVDASLEPARPPDPLYGDLDDREADVINLAGILYAALTGRWPGVARSSVPRAPREARRPLRPRQVRPGVPRTLDALCERVLHKEGSRHALPIETAHEIAAALADFVGDPAGQAAPLEPAALHVEPTVSMSRSDLTAGPAGAGLAGAAPGTQLAAGVAPEEAGPRTGEDVEREAGPDVGGAAIADPDSTQLSAALGRGADPEDTQLHREPLESPDSLSPLRAPVVEAAPPPPPFEEIPERPLFAQTERRVPPRTEAAYAESSASVPVWADTGPEAPYAPDAEDTGSDTGGFWPFTDVDDSINDVHTGREGRGWLRIAIAVAVVLAVLVAMAIAFTRGRGDGTPNAADPSTGPSSTPSATSTAGATIKVVGADDFDPPPAGGGDENPADVGHVIDGDPATSWRTTTYFNRPNLGGLKPGVGVLLDLGREQDPRQVQLQLTGSPTSVEVYAAPSGVTKAPDTLAQLDKVAARADAPERTTLALASKTRTRFLLVWLTRLPAVSGGYRGEIDEITVRS